MKTTEVIIVFFLMTAIFFAAPTALQWEDRRDFGGYDQATSSASTNNGVVVAGVGSGYLQVFDYANDGTVRWSNQIGPTTGDGPTGTAVDGDRIYVAGTLRTATSKQVTIQRIIRAYRDDGDVLWTRTTPFPAATGVVAFDGEVVTWGGDLLETLDSNGNLLWQDRIPNSPDTNWQIGTATIDRANHFLYVAMNQSWTPYVTFIRAYRLTTGERLWDTEQAPTRLYDLTYSVTHDLLYSVGLGGLEAREVADGTIVWSDSGARSDVIVDENAWIVYTAGSGGVEAYWADDGAEVWTRPNALRTDGRTESALKLGLLPSGPDGISGRLLVAGMINQGWSGRRGPSMEYLVEVLNGRDGSIQFRESFGKTEPRNYIGGVSGLTWAAGVYGDWSARSYR